MAFTDALIDHADVRVAMVDRLHGVGGHWLEAYPFVRLHQASAFYGVESTLLGDLGCSNVDLSLACMSVVNLANDVIARCNRAVAAAAPLDPSESAQLKQSGLPGAPRCSGQSRTMRRQHLLRKDLGDESEPDAANLGATSRRTSIPSGTRFLRVASLLGYGETKARMLIICGDLRSLKPHFE
jgi:hypothetical protein